MYRRSKYVFHQFKELIIIAVLLVLLVNILSLHYARSISTQPVTPALLLPDDVTNKQPRPPPSEPPQNAEDDSKDESRGPVKDAADDVAFANGKPRKAPAKLPPVTPSQEKGAKEENKKEKDVQEEEEKGSEYNAEVQPSVRDPEDDIAAVGENGNPKQAAVAKNGIKTIEKGPEGAANSKIKVNGKNAQDFKRTCTAVENVYMLNVHKSGSTTLQNILWRLGFARNRRMLIFPKVSPYPFLKYHETYAPPTDPDFSGKHNIMCEHSIYYKPAIQTTMPENTRNIAILREPLAQLRSAAEYYGVVHKLVGVARNVSTDQVLKTFLTNPMKYEPHVVPPDVYKVRDHVVNMFGFEDWKSVDNPAEFDKFMRRKDEEFFVLILERMTESLVLLRRHMCWGIKEVLTLPLKPSHAKDDHEEEDSIEDLEMEYRDYNPGDYAVYDFFIRKIGYRIDDIVDKNDFWAEVRWYDAVQAKSQTFCQDICHDLKGLNVKDRDAIKKILSKSISFEASVWDASFDVFGSDCLLMMFNPDVFRNAVKVLNYPQLCDPDKRGKGRDSRWSIPPEYCKKDYFKYTIPWDVITDPEQYVYKCL